MTTEREKLIEELKAESAAMHERKDLPGIYQLALLIDRAIAALSQPAGVPDEEWVLVPREPTESMCAAGNEWTLGPRDTQGCYEAMLAAVPPPPAAQQDGAISAQALEDLIIWHGKDGTKKGQLTTTALTAYRDFLCAAQQDMHMGRIEAMGDHLAAQQDDGTLVPIPTSLLDRMDTLIEKAKANAAQQGSAEAVASSPDKVRAALMELELFVRVLGLDSEPARKAAEMAREALATGSTPRAGVVTKNAVAWKYRNPKKPHLWKVTMTKPINTGMEVVPLVEMPNPAPTDPAVLRDAVERLAKKWEKVAEKQGVVNFTGAQHKLFANELRAAIAEQAKG